MRGEVSFKIPPERRQFNKFKTDNAALRKENRKLVKLNEELNQNLVLLGNRIDSLRDELLKKLTQIHFSISRQ